VNGANIVNSLAALLIVTSVLVIDAKRPSRAALLYGLQSLVLVSVFAALAFFTGASQLYLWALTAFATKVILVPAILYRTLRKFDQAPPLPSPMRPAASIGLAALALIVSAVVVLQIELPGAAAFKPALMVSLAHFFLGLACIITQRNILKQIFGYCLMENGSHLTLALLAYQAPELVEIGVATDAIFAVIVMAVIATRIQKTVHSLDSHDLMTLKG
jgi:hydrogenase-4 component E